VANFEVEARFVAGHENILVLTLGNSSPDPRAPGKYINSETYIHSKNMAVFSGDGAVMTGGSANIAFTSMWFHSEMNIAFMDRTRIQKWVAQLWSEHLGIAAAQARDLIAKPAEAFTFFKYQADHNRTVALQNGEAPAGRVFYKEGTQFPPRKLQGIALPKMADTAVATKATGQ
jgi:phosphatidylserine/phosphatidylglycerophosphate/cardiolipin synthase-like enzyme